MKPSDPTSEIPIPEDSAEARKLRRQMVKQQLLTRDITDPSVIKAMAKVPRHLFGRFKTLKDAYADSAAAIECMQTISQPYMVAYMTQALELAAEHKVLEIGTGSGYQTAILSELARRVHTIERHKSLSEQAQTLLTRLGYTQIHFYVGDGAQGLPQEMPFDRIIVTAAAQKHPTHLRSYAG